MGTFLAHKAQTPTILLQTTGKLIESKIKGTCSYVAIYVHGNALQSLSCVNLAGSYSYIIWQPLANIFWDRLSDWMYFYKW